VLEHPAVLVCPSGTFEAISRTLRYVLETTSPQTLLLVPSDEPAFVDRNVIGDRAVQSLDCAAGAGVAAAINEAARRTGRADLAVVADTCDLPARWLEQLRDAAHADDTIGTACAVADPIFGQLRLDGAAAPGDPTAASRSAVHPRVLLLRPPCTFIRRSAIDLSGPLDERLRHPGTALADLGAKALACGMSCVLADEVRARPMPGGLGAFPEAELDLLRTAHPWVDVARDDESALEIGPLRRAVIAHRALRSGPSVTIDARALGPAVGGTQTYVRALVLALAGLRSMRVRAIVADDAPPDALEAFAAADVDLASYAQAAAGIAKTDIVHRPQQVFTPADLELLHQVGERIVLTHMDLIAYRNPTYHSTPQHWRAYRRTTRLALAVADRVVFFSEHARADALAEDLVENERAAVAGIGVTAPLDDAASVRPAPVPADRDLLLMLGANYLHKNRPFALRLVDELRRRHGWDGLLVFAGTHVPHGSSTALETRELHASPDLADNVVDVGPVSEAEKRWLSTRAVAHLAPSTYEGFGLAPLEAAIAGKPCLYAARTSLSEIGDPAAATLVPWDPVQSADGVAPLLRPGPERTRHLGLLSRAAQRWSWDAVTPQLHEVYLEAIASPYRPSAPRAWEELQREERLAEVDAHWTDIVERVAHGLPLIDRDGLLTKDQQQGLMRIASRPWLRVPLLGPVGLIGGLKRRGESRR
jgi:glycosyltransferase involved in cell wall biosynthesis